MRFPDLKSREAYAIILNICKTDERAEEQMLKKWYAKLLVLLAVVCAVAAAHPAAQAEAIPEETAQTQAESDTAVQGAEMVASGTCGDNLTWSLDSAGTLTISGSGAMTDYSINNADSTTAPWRNYASSICSVVFEPGVTSIGRHTFYKFQNLKSIRFPNDYFSRLSTIGEGAFECTGLTGTLSLPYGVTVIENGAFSECINLTGLSLPSSLTSIGSYAFCNCNSLTGTLEFPSGLESIGGSAFKGCYNMTGPLTFPSRLTYIGPDAFDNCSGLGRLAFFEGDAPSATATSLRNGTRVYYRPGTSGWKDSSVYDITTGTWNGYPLNVWNSNDALASGTCGENLTWSLSADGVFTISGSGQMENYSKTSDHTMTAPWSDFSAAIRKVIIEPGVTSIGERAFYNCKSITDITLPDGLTSIGYAAFSSCTALAGDLVFPDSLTRIGSIAFSTCTGLTGTLIFPASLTEISSNAFIDCTGLDKIAFFLGNAPREQKAPLVADTTVYYRSGTSGWSSSGSWCGYRLKEVQSDTVAIGLCGAEDGGENLTWRLDRDGMLTISGSGAMADYNGTTTTPWARYFLSIHAVKVESGVTSIGRYAFNNYVAITDVFLPDGLTSIGYAAFENCTALTGKLSLPKSLTDINSKAFKNCTGISGELVIPDGVRTIAEESFCGCSGLTGTLRIPSGVYEIRSSAFMGCTGLSKLILPDKISKIRDGAFYECTGLSELILPQSIFTVDIEGSAFFGCTSLSGTLTIPKNVRLGGGAFAGCTGITAFAAKDYYSADDSGALYEGSTLCVFPAGAPLETYTVQDGTSIIGRYAFSGCCNLDTVIVPATVQKIDWNAFERMPKLKSVYFYGNYPPTSSAYFPKNEGSRLKIYYMKNADGWTEENWPSQYFELIEWNPYAVTGVELDAETLTLPLGKTQKLVATVLPEWAEDKSVTWASADIDIAAVFADGTVLGKKAGTTTVTATTADGGFTASCTVTVKPAPDGVMPVRLDSVCARPGNTVQVRLMLDENPGFANLSLVIGYDADVMTLTKVENKVSGTEYTGSQTLTADPYMLTWNSVRDCTASGTLAILTFQIKNTAAYGMYPISVSFYKGLQGTYKDGVNVNYDQSRNALPLVYVGSSAEIRSYIPGDISGDGRVDSRDVLNLLRHLSGWKGITVVEEALDVNGDGESDFRDVTALLQYIAGWDVVLH